MKERWIQLYQNERKSEQAHIPYVPTLLDNAAHNECQCNTLMMGNQTENYINWILLYQETHNR